MSAYPKQSKSESNRVGAADEPAAMADDRSVRQRIGPSSSSCAAAGSSSATSASFDAQSSASSLSASALIGPSLMRLAVVERQLIMQGLDLTSLARLASTCSQLRAEAIHKEAGKFIPVPSRTPPGSCRLLQFPQHEESHPAHLSPLFRAHMPVLLCLAIPESAESLDLRMLEPLLRKIDSFSHITELIISSQWLYAVCPEALMLAVLNRPCIQRVETIHLFVPNCLKQPMVQAALFALPCLATIQLPELAEGVSLIKSALAQAHALRTILTLSVLPEQARSIRALRSAPGVTKLSLAHADPRLAGGAAFAPIVWCLSSTLQSLCLCHWDVREPAASRSLLKAMFLRMPALHSFRATSMQPSPLLQGMLDAGVQSLPRLRRVEFGWMSGPLPPALLRRFLHRFPAVHAQIELEDGEHETTAGQAIARRFGGWPRVEVIPPPAKNDGPPAADKADDVDGPSVEAAVDPGSDDEK